MNEIINSNAVSAGAAVASALATIVTAFIAHWAIRAQEKQTTETIQAQKEQTTEAIRAQKEQTTEAIRAQEKQTRWLTQMDFLLRTHERFNGQEMRQLRKEVAKEYLRRCDIGSPSYTDDVFFWKVSLVINYFDFVGRQVKNNALDGKEVKASFAYWVIHYFQAFEEYINSSLEMEGNDLWKGALDLYVICGGTVEDISLKKRVKNPRIDNKNVIKFFSLERFL